MFRFLLLVASVFVLVSNVLAGLTWHLTSFVLAGELFTLFAPFRFCGQAPLATHFGVSVWFFFPSHLVVWTLLRLELFCVLADSAVVVLLLMHSAPCFLLFLMICRVRLVHDLV